jgi:hypothetical protein
MKVELRFAAFDHVVHLDGYAGTFLKRNEPHGLRLYLISEGVVALFENFPERGQALIKGNFSCVPTNSNFSWLDEHHKKDPADVEKVLAIKAAQKKK